VGRRDDVSFLFLAGVLVRRVCQGGAKRGFAAAAAAAADLLAQLVLGLMHWGLALGLQVSGHDFRKWERLQR